MYVYVFCICMSGPFHKGKRRGEAGTATEEERERTGRTYQPATMPVNEFKEADQVSRGHCVAGGVEGGRVGGWAGGRAGAEGKGAEEGKGGQVV